MSSLNQDKQENESYLWCELVVLYSITFTSEMLREESSAMWDKQYLKLVLLLTFFTVLNFLEQISIIYEGKKKKGGGRKGGGIKKSIRSEITTCHYNKSNYYSFFFLNARLFVLTISTAH